MAVWFWCTQVKFPSEETKMKLSFHKGSSVPWRQWVLNQGVGHIATRCYIKYLCCEEALDSSRDLIKHLFWHSNETSVISVFLLINNCDASSIFAKTFHLLQRHSWVYYFSFWLPVQPCHGFLSQFAIFVCQSIRHLPILLEDLQTLGEMTSFVKLWDEEGENFLDSWIT